MARLAQSYYQSGALCSPYSGMWTEGSKTVLKCSSFPSGSPQGSEGAVTAREGSHCKLVMTSTFLSGCKSKAVFSWAFTSVGWFTRELALQSKHKKSKRQTYSWDRRHGLYYLMLCLKQCPLSLSGCLVSRPCCVAQAGLQVLICPTAFQVLGEGGCHHHT